MTSFLPPVVPKNRGRALFPTAAHRSISQNSTPTTIFHRSSFGLTAGHGNDHRHIFSILLEGATVEGGEIALLEEDSDKDVTRRGNREDQMPQRHMRSGPEGD